MLILTCKLGNEIINCYDGTHNKEQLKKWASKKILLCPACGKPYEYCHGRIKTPYFRHMDKTECDAFFSEPETDEHLNGKIDLFNWIKKQNGVSNVVLEGWLPATKQRPDIMFEYFGKQYVIEYQCTPIASEYVERHELYLAANITDIWIAGYEKYHKENSRHKYIEDYIQGYYNPSTKIFTVSDNTKQGIFIKKMNIKNAFNLNNFCLDNRDIIHKSYIGKDFDNLYDLHLRRITCHENDVLSEKVVIENKIKAAVKCLDVFNGEISEINSYPYKNKKSYYLYGNNNAPFFKIRLDINKNGLYKDIYDIKKNAEVTTILDDLFCRYSNQNWHFFSDICDNGIEIRVSLLGYEFTKRKIISHNNINIKKEDSIKNVLFQIMNECYEEGLIGNRYVRIMEV